MIRKDFSLHVLLIVLSFLSTPVFAADKALNHVSINISNPKNQNRPQLMQVSEGTIIVYAGTSDFNGARSELQITNNGPSILNNISIVKNDFNNDNDISIEGLDSCNSLQSNKTCTIQIIPGENEANGNIKITLNFAGASSGSGTIQVEVKSALKLEPPTLVLPSITDSGNVTFRNQSPFTLDSFNIDTTDASNKGYLLNDNTCTELAENETCSLTFENMGAEGAAIYGVIAKQKGNMSSSVRVNGALTNQNE